LRFRIPARPKKLILERRRPAAQRADVCIQTETSSVFFAGERKKAPCLFGLGFEGPQAASSSARMSEPQQVFLRLLQTALGLRFAVAELEIPRPLRKFRAAACFFAE
jgi:hypothetical protein